MSFLLFLGYFIASMIVWEAAMFIFATVAKFFLKRKLKKAIKGGKVKIMTMEDLIEQIAEKKEQGDGSWH